MLLELSNNQNHELGEYVLIIEKNDKVLNNDEDSLTIEALIVNEMIINNCTMKDAIKLVSEKYHYNKNIVYDASLNIKKLFEK